MIYLQDECPYSVVRTCCHQGGSIGRPRSISVIAMTMETDDKPG